MQLDAFFCNKQSPAPSPCSSQRPAVLLAAAPPRLPPPDKAYHTRSSPGGRGCCGRAELPQGLQLIAGGAGRGQRQAPPRPPRSPCAVDKGGLQENLESGSEVDPAGEWVEKPADSRLCDWSRGHWWSGKGEERGQALCHLSLGQSPGLRRAMAIVPLPPSRPRAHSSFCKLPPGTCSSAGRTQPDTHRSTDPWCLCEPGSMPASFAQGHASDVLLCVARVVRSHFCLLFHCITIP